MQLKYLLDMYKHDAPALRAVLQIAGLECKEPFGGDSEIVLCIFDGLRYHEFKMVGDDLCIDAIVHNGLTYVNVLSEMFDDPAFGDGVKIEACLLNREI